ncbi:hypothetical protein CY35_17G097400 [Sphagnum magellanicum]|nr:hypothetical protein CY35_17G097400 [Sphagnum magellanicum]
MISFASWSSSAESFCTGIEHVESLPMAIGILKTECEVCPPSNRRAIMPKEATPMAMCSSHRTDANNTLYTKVLLDPPGLSKKNTAPSPWAIALNTIVTAIYWQKLNRGRFSST